jgi:transposase-like protein
VLCIDEVHERGCTILFATDPLLNATVGWRVVKKNDQPSMDSFLDELKKAGFAPEVVITDGSPLYKDALQEIWRDVEHQLCIFHVIKEVNKLILDALRAVKNRINRQGNKGRKKKRGRRSGKAKKRRLALKKRTRKEAAAFLWEHQYLIVRKEESMTKEDKENLREMFRIAPELHTLRKFNRQFYALFERGITQRQARRRGTRMVNNAGYQANSFLRKALKKLRKERFEKMIVFLGRGEDAERTSNHVERNNRAFRLVQKTRYRRRRMHTIELALWLHVCRAWRKHPLYGRIPKARSSGTAQQPSPRRAA